MAAKRSGRTAKRAGTAKPAKPVGKAQPRRSTKADETVANGDIPQSVKTLAKADRYRLIYAKQRAGHDLQKVAEEFSTDKEPISARRAREICDELRAGKNVYPVTTSPQEALRIFDELIDQYDHAIGIDVEILEGALKAKHWSAATGASKRLGEARKERLELLMARGVLPANLAMLEWHADAELVWTAIEEVFEENGIPMEIREEITRRAGLRAGLAADEVPQPDGPGELVSGEVV
jgi:hypothetical protein